jgi:superfamily II DNA or RNA helicase
MTRTITRPGPGATLAPIVSPAALPIVAVEAVFVPGDPPRTGLFALWGDGFGIDAPLPPGRISDVELVLPTTKMVRRRREPARLVDLPDALSWLVGLPADADISPSLAAWATAAKLGAQLIARGRLLPAASPAGWDAWRVGPLDPADADRLGALAAAFPPEAHALPVPGTAPLRVRNPAAIIRDLWDAIADRLVRSPAAYRTVANSAFAHVDDIAPVGELAEWLAVADRAIDAGARPGLRLELPDGADGEFRAVVQLRSTVDPSLVVDASHLWDAPAVVLSRMGDTVDADLFVALRRGARAWPPLGRILDEARPEMIVLDDDEVGELLGPAAEALGGAGVEVLWPSDLAAHGLSLRAVVSQTSSPAPVTEATFGIEGLLEFRWEVAIGGEALTAEEVAVLAEAKRPMIRLRGRWVTVDPALIEKLKRKRSRRLTPSEALAAALMEEIDVDGERAAFRAEGALAALASKLHRIGDGGAEADPPPGLTATLRPYQRRGLAWLTEMCELGVGGCLADDMGLGKTVQVIALHLALHDRGLRQPTLVVCPTSLLGNWERELHRFAPAVPVRRFHGGGRHLEEVGADEVVLVTYGVVRRDRAALAGVAWGVMVADEAQHAKNPLSRTAREMRQVPATARVALTGTPVENRLTELWSILDWTTPGLLGPLEAFRRGVAVPVERYRDPDATQRLTSLVRPFLLRRRKSDPGIAPELPPKTETDVVVPLTAEQTTLYEAVVRETMAAIEEKEGVERRGLVFKLLTGLKQICNHPAQFLHQGGPLDGRSGKLAALDELLDVIVDAGDSVLVFSQYVQMAALIEAHLAQRGVPTQLLHGQVPVHRRDEMVGRFQAGEVPVFLLSLKAGGTGLNLTRATHVVHYDRWWNPAVEDQASDRAYRIGQDRPVQVHRLVTEGTLEDKIAELLASKRDLAERVVGSGEGWISELSDSELARLVSLGPST